MAPGILGRYTRTVSRIHVRPMAHICSCSRLATLGIALAGHSLTAQVHLFTEQSIYTTVFNWEAHQGHYKVLLVRDSTLPGFVLKFGRFGPTGSDTAFLDKRQEAALVPVDTAAVMVPVVLLGDTIEHSRDWDPIYRRRDRPSPVLRLSGLALTPDSSRAAILVQRRCAPGLCGDMVRLELHRSPDTPWRVDSVRTVLVY
jgi:hypothetical protein